MTTLTCFEVENRDFMWTCTVDVSQIQSATLLWHHQPGQTSVASGLQLDPGRGTLSMVEVRYIQRTVADFNANTYNRYLRDDFKIGERLPDRMQIRILSRAHQTEVYVDDAWIFSMDMSDLPPAGSMGVLAYSGAVQISDISVTELEPLTAGGDR